MLASSFECYAVSGPFEKRKSSEHERVERLVAKMERSVRLAFEQFVDNVQSPDAMREVADLLGRNDVEGALRVIDRYVTRLAPILSTVFQAAAVDETSALVEQVKSWAPVVGLRFDPTDTRAATLMRDSQLQFIAEFSSTQREATRQALSQALIDGKGSRATAKAFRDSIGLTAGMEETVRNYRRLLEEGSREALERELRDRRYDRSIIRADTTDEPLSAKQIEAMTERYRQNYLRFRSETIAITETGRVVGAGRQESFDQIAADIDLDDSQIERDWFTHRDGRERWSHRHMQVRKVRGRQAPFITGAGVPMMRPHAEGAPADEVVRCRCFQNFRIRKPGG